MIPSATPFNKWYSDPKQLQALEVREYQSTELQADRTFAVAHRRERIHANLQTRPQDSLRPRQFQPLGAAYRQQDKEPHLRGNRVLHKRTKMG
jgi:hypothetical protein